MRRALCFSAPLAAYALFAAADLATSLEPPRWFRGNTHAHTVRCGHADSTPEAVARWYHDRGYHFVVLSEHNEFIDPATVALPEGARPDFVLVPGEELTGPRGLHTTAVGVRALVDGKVDKDAPAPQVIAAHVERTHAAGGVPILNHPNYRWAVRREDALAVERLELLEIENGHPDVNDAGDAKHPSVEDLWDALLGTGRRVWGVAADDAHHFRTWAADQSNPGRAWIMVEADGPTVDALVASIRAGRFHASSGVVLAALRAGPRWLELEVDEEATRRELALGTAAGRPGGSAAGVVIEAIGPGGEVVERVQGARARFTLREGAPYLRARVTWTRAREGGGLERFFAWSQPIFGS